jgi:uncharacterized SAM-binding protein YcdF (DUF218 family)
MLKAEPRDQRANGKGQEQAAPLHGRWVRRLAFCLAVLCLLASVLYFLRSPLLTGLANAWIVNDPLQHADAILVLGGGLETRPFAAARLYRDGYAPRILVAQPKASPTDALGLTTREQDVARQVLIKEGVPESAITGIGEDVETTYAESLAVRAWLSTNHASRIIIPTDPFHTRRVRWLFCKQLKGTGVQVIVEAVPVREYTQGDWWRHEQGLIAFQNEAVKSIYYHLKY